MERERPVVTQETRVVSDREPAVPAGRRMDKTTKKTLTGSYGLEALAGAGVAVLGILALAGVLPFWLTAIAVIVAGGGFLVEGAGAAARANQISQAYGAGREEEAALGTGVTAEMLTGAAGIVMGILSILGVVPGVLLPASAIVFGAGLLLGTAATQIATEAEGPEGARSALRAFQAARAANGARVLVGAAAVALGIIALIGIEALVLTAVALLAIGSMMLLNGAALSARFGTARAR